MQRGHHGPVVWTQSPRGCLWSVVGKRQRAQHHGLGNRRCCAGADPKRGELLFDLGQITGSTVAGRATDKLSTRAPLLVAMLVLSSGVLALMFHASDMATMCLLLVATGPAWSALYADQHDGCSRPQHASLTPGELAGARSRHG